VLEKAVRGVYTSDRCKVIPAQLQQKYMLKGQNACAESLRFKPHVRGMIDFMHLNLMHQLPKDYTCSVIFCRNIMIYFDRQTQQDLVRRLTEHLDPGGYLFIGHSESLNSITHALDYVAPATYRKAINGRSNGRHA
jgi:chemotaxis protein methyltransferase CheR